VPPSFPPTHAWACPYWMWSHGQLTHPGATIFGGAWTSTWATTTMLYVANSRSAAISIHVDCYLSDGTLETGVRVAGSVGALQRFEASLLPTRAPQVQSNGDYREGGKGWFQLWADGPVTPAAVITVILGTPFEMVVPLEPVEIEPAVAVAEAPPWVTAEAAPEGVGAATETLEANLSLPETVAWFESVRSGREFRRHEK